MSSTSLYQGNEGPENPFVQAVFVIALIILFLLCIQHGSNLIDSLEDCLLEIRRNIPSIPM